MRPIHHTTDCTTDCRVNTPPQAAAPTPAPQPLQRRWGTLVKSALLAAVPLLWVATPAQADNGRPQMHLPRTEITVGMYRIDAQVAQGFNERQIGLMHRKSMPPQEGMLFVFEQPGVQCFWMKNTLLPLTAAFVQDDGTITNLADMQPMSEDSHCSAKPVRYVLEMNQGWFASKGIKAGTQLRGAAFSAR